MDFQNVTPHVFSGNGNSVGWRLQRGIRYLPMTAGGGATFTWQISFDRENAADDASATWFDLARDGSGALASYTLTSAQTRVVPFVNEIPETWLRCVLSNYVSGSPTAGVR